MFKVQGSMFNVVLGSVPDVPVVRLAHYERNLKRCAPFKTFRAEFAVASDLAR